VVADVAVSIDDVERRPVVVVERVPEGVAVVDRDGVSDPEVTNSAAYVLDVALERELRGVDTDDDEPFVVVALGPGADVREGPESVDARVGPEISEYDRGCAARSRRRQPRAAPQRGAFAHLCGSSPIDTSSGLVVCKRLNRGGDRRANEALWRIVMVRTVSDPRTAATSSAGPRKDGPSGRSSAASSATSPESSTPSSLPDRRLDNP
jgi:hypothetical protein